MSSVGGGGKPTVKKNGTIIGTQAAINLIEGANVTITTADDGANGEVDVTIASSGGGSAGFDLLEEGVSQGIVTSVNVVGAAATASAVGAVGTLTISAASLASAAPENVTKAAAAVGVGTTAARVDHKHDITTAAASTLSVGGSNAEGTATSLARSDHTHALPAFGTTGGTFAQGNDSRFTDARTPTAHASTHLSNGSDPIAAATTSVGGLFSAADKTKVDGIATGATKGITTQDEGAGGGSEQTTLNFVGAGVSASSAGAVTTVTIAGGGSGDVVGPGSATDNAVARFDATTGKLIQNSAVTIDDSGNIATAGTVDGRDVSVDGTKLDGIAASATNGITTQDEGSTIGSNQTTLDFVGAGVSAATVGAKTTVTIAGGGGGVSDGDKGDITVSASGATWTIDNDAVTYAKLQNVSATDRLLGRDTAAAGDVEELTVSGGLEFTGGPGIQRSALTGDVTATAGSNATTIAANAVTFAKMATQAALSVVANATNATAVPSAVAAAADGDVLRRSGTALGFGTIATAGIANNAVTLAKMATQAALSVLANDTNAVAVPAAVAAASDHQVMRRSGTALAFGAVNLAQAAAVTGTLPVGNGGTGAATFTANAVLKGNTTSALVASGVSIGSADELTGYKASVNAQTGTTYTTVDGDCGKVITLSNASAITVTLHQTAAAGFNCTFIQAGAGQVTFVAGSGAAMHVLSSHTKTAGQYAMVGAVVKSNAGSAAQWNLGGATAA